MPENTGRRRGSLQYEKNGVWLMRLSLGGKRYARSSGTRERSVAETRLKEYVLKVMRENPPRVCEEPPLMAAWARYAASPKTVILAASTRVMKKRAWRHFAIWMKDAHPEVTDVRHVTPNMADAYMAWFQNRHTAVTSNLRVCTLREIFRMLRGDRNEVLAHVPVRVNDSRPRRELTVDEVRRLLDAAEGVGGEWPALFKLALYTGMRFGDCCCLRWEDVKLPQGVIQIVPRKTCRYGARPVTIPIHDQLRAVMAATPVEKRSGYFLPGLAHDYAACRWRSAKTLNLIFKAAKIVSAVRYEGRSRLTPVATFHSLRHSFVSFAANAGVPLVVVQTIVGHTSSAMTRHYYHASEAALRQAVNAIPSFGETCPSEPERKDEAPDKTAAEASPGRGAQTLRQRLIYVNRLLKSGLITADEYAAARARILADA